MVRDELEKIGRSGMLPAGVVLCGSAVKTPGVVDLARDILGLPVQIGFPREIEGIVDRVDDPGFSSVIGLLHFANRYGTTRSFDFNFDAVRTYFLVLWYFLKVLSTNKYLCRNILYALDEENFVPLNYYLAYHHARFKPYFSYS